MVTLWRHIALCLASSALLFGCAATPIGHSAAPKQSLSKTLKSDQIISLPYQIYGNGVFVVSMRTDDGLVLPFAIDTGATQSALYRSTVRRLNLKIGDNAKVKVHGMNDTGHRPIAIVPRLYMGSHILTDTPMAVLKDRIDPVDTAIRLTGLLGMDIMDGFRIYVDADAKTFNFIPRTIPEPRIPGGWQTVNLYENPFIDNTHNLHFMQIRVGNHLLPALLDTGSEQNLMSWSVSKFPQLRRARKRLYEKWVIEGAVGSFDPRYLITTKNIRSGQKYWDESEFIVMDFDGLDILGVNDQPFLIAGSPMLAEQTFYLDFAENIIRFKPGLVTRRARSLTNAATVYRERDTAQ